MFHSAAVWCCQRASRKLALKHSDPLLRKRGWQRWRFAVLANAWVAALLAVGCGVFALWLWRFINRADVGFPALPGPAPSLLSYVFIWALFSLVFVLLSAFGFRLGRVSRDWSLLA